MSLPVTRESLPTIMDDLFAVSEPMSKDYWRAKIADLQNCLMDFDEKLEVPPRHIFSKGVYARELFLPKWSLIVGKIHKTAHINIISCGDVVVVTEDGVERFVAPHTFVSKVGTKRVVFAREDSIWTTIHPTTETDVQKIEDEIICKDYSELELIASL
jgi:hypothetical protein